MRIIEGVLSTEVLRGSGDKMKLVEGAKLDRIVIEWCFKDRHGCGCWIIMGDLGE